MAENKEGINGLIGKFALLADELSILYPNSRAVVIFSLNNEDFNNTKLQLQDFSQTEQFKIDISGIEFIFLKETLLNNVEDNVLKIPDLPTKRKGTFFGWLKNLL
jgi:hypothetical protein